MKLRLPGLSRSRDRRTWLVVGLAIIGLALVIWAVLPSDSPVRRIAGQETEESDSVQEDAPDTSEQGPDEILVPSIEIEAPLVSIDLASDGVLTPPRTPTSWAGGTAAPSPAAARVRPWSPDTPSAPVVG